MMFYLGRGFFLLAVLFELAPSSSVAVSPSSSTALFFPSFFKEETEGSGLSRLERVLAGKAWIRQKKQGARMMLPGWKALTALICSFLFEGD